MDTNKRAPIQIGLLIEKELKRNQNSIVYGVGEGVDTLNFKIKVANGRPSLSFITNKTIRDSLADYKSDGKPFGEIVFIYNPKSRLLKYYHFYPLPKRSVEGSIFSKPREEFSRRNIASLIESHVLKIAKRTFPNAKKVKFFLPSPYLKSRLRKIGIDHRGESSFNTLVKKVRDKTTKNIKYHRKR